MTERPKRTDAKIPGKAVTKTASATLRPATGVVSAGEFDEVLALIEAARQRAYQAVNTELVGLYWQLGAYISDKIESAQWGDGVVDDLAAAIGRQYPGMRGYTRSNLFRMQQFYETYRSSEKVAPLVRQLPWTHHLIILGRTKYPEEREFYMLSAIQGRRTKRELERHFLLRAELDAAFFHLYGIERDDVDYIMETFPIVRKNDEKANGEYRTKRVILEIYDEMAEAIHIGKHYQTRLDPPPADPRVAHPPRDKQAEGTS